VYDAINTIQATLPKVQQARERAQAAGNTDLAQQLQTLAGRQAVAAVAAVVRWRSRTRRRGGRASLASRRRAVVRAVRLHAGRQQHSAFADARRDRGALKEYDAVMARSLLLFR
jgi:hypothetical protein